MSGLILKLTRFCALIFACALVCPAQGTQKKDPAKSKPDLSGLWLLDWDKSNVGKPASPTVVKLKIHHWEPEINLRRTIERNGGSINLYFTYFTDGRSESNPTTMYVTDNPGAPNPSSGKEISKSQTRWSGGKLVTRTFVRNILSARVVEYEMVDEWKLSADGKTLTQTTRWIYQPDPFGKSVYVPARAPDMKRIYKRIP